MASRGQRPPPTSTPASIRSGGIGSAPGGLNTATAAMSNLQLGGAKAARPPPGMSASARRAKPIGLTLDKLMGSSAPSGPPPAPSLRGAGGGAGGAGLGPGRALSIGTPPRRPQPAGTPFSNFSTIVYAVPDLNPIEDLTAKLLLPFLQIVIRLVPSTLLAKRCCMRRESTFRTGHLLLLTWASLNSTKSWGEVITVRSRKFYTSQPTSSWR